MKKRKKLIKRIGAGVCALMMVVGCLGIESYYADDTIDSLIPVFRDTFIYHGEGPVSLPSRYTSGTYKNYLLLYDEGNWGCYFTNEDSFVLETKYDTYDGGKALGLFLGLYNKCPYSSSKDNGVSWSDSSSKAWQLATLYTETRLPLKEKSIFYISSCPVYVGDVLFLNGNEGTLPSGQGTYNSSLGYLQNVTSKRMNIYNDDSNYQSKYKFSFDTVSSTGVDLTSGNYLVRLYEQTSIYIDNIWQPFDTPKVHIGDFNASSGSLSFNISEALAKTDAETGEIEGYNFLTIALNNYVRADTYWLQIYNSDSGEYGGFVQLKNNPKLPGQFTISTVHGSESDVSGTNGVDNGGYVDRVIDTNIGTGTNYEDAELNADNNDGLGELDDFENALNDYVSTLGSIPIMISNMFSFMPPWCLGVVGVSFSFLAILIVYKLIRG